MIMFTTSDTAIRELAHRAGDGFDVTLLWDSAANQVFVAVAEERTGAWFTRDVRAADALQAFHHPFAYESADHDGQAPEPVENRAG